MGNILSSCLKSKTTDQKKNKKRISINLDYYNQKPDLPIRLYEKPENTIHLEEDNHIIYQVSTVGLIDRRQTLRRIRKNVLEPVSYLEVNRFYRNHSALRFAYEPSYTEIYFLHYNKMPEKIIIEKKTCIEGDDEECTSEPWRRKRDFLSGSDMLQNLKKISAVSRENFIYENHESSEFVIMQESIHSNDFQVDELTSTYAEPMSPEVLDSKKDTKAIVDKKSCIESDDDDCTNEARRRSECNLSRNGSVKSVASIDTSNKNETAHIKVEEKTTEIIQSTSAADTTSVPYPHKVFEMETPKNRCTNQLSNDKLHAVGKTLAVSEETLLCQNHKGSEFVIMQESIHSNDFQVDELTSTYAEPMSPEVLDSKKDTKAIVNKKLCIESDDDDCTNEARRRSECNLSRNGSVKSVASIDTSNKNETAHIKVEEKTTEIIQSTSAADTTSVPYPHKVFEMETPKNRCTNQLSNDKLHAVGKTLAVSEENLLCQNHKGSEFVIMQESIHSNDFQVDELTSTYAEPMSPEVLDSKKDTKAIVDKKLCIESDDDDCTNEARRRSECNLSRNGSVKSVASIDTSNKNETAHIKVEEKTTEIIQSTSAADTTSVPYPHKVFEMETPKNRCTNQLSNDKLHAVGKTLAVSEENLLCQNHKGSEFVIMQESIHSNDFQVDELTSTYAEPMSPEVLDSKKDTKAIVDKKLCIESDDDDCTNEARRRSECNLSRNGSVKSVASIDTSNKNETAHIKVEEKTTEIIQSTSAADTTSVPYPHKVFEMETPKNRCTNQLSNDKLHAVGKTLAVSEENLLCQNHKGSEFVIMQESIHSNDFKADELTSTYAEPMSPEVRDSKKDTEAIVDNKSCIESDDDDCTNEAWRRSECNLSRNASVKSVAAIDTSNKNETAHIKVEEKTTEIIQSTSAADITSVSYPHKVFEMETPKNRCTNQLSNDKIHAVGKTLAVSEENLLSQNHKGSEFVIRQETIHSNDFNGNDLTSTSTEPMSPTVPDSKKDKEAIVDNKSCIESDDEDCMNEGWRRNKYTLSRNVSAKSGASVDTLNKNGTAHIKVEEKTTEIIQSTSAADTTSVPYPHNVFEMETPKNRCTNQLSNDKLHAVGKTLAISKENIHCQNHKNFSDYSMQRPVYRHSSRDEVYGKLKSPIKTKYQNGTDIFKLTISLYENRIDSVPLYSRYAKNKGETSGNDLLISSTSRLRTVSEADKQEMNRRVELSRIVNEKQVARADKRRKRKDEGSDSDEDSPNE